MKQTCDLTYESELLCFIIECVEVCFGDRWCESSN